MATRPLRPCLHPRCRKRVVQGNCPDHGRVDTRPSASQRMYGARWRRESKAFLAQHPYCVLCACQGRETKGTLVDHIKAHKGDPGLFWDKSNWQSACAPCNRSKANREEGGYGNPIPKASTCS